MATDVSDQSLKKNLIFLFQPAFLEVTPMSAQFSGQRLAHTVLKHLTSIQLPLSASGPVFGLGSTFQVWALFKSASILIFCCRLRSLLHEYRLPDSQGCMECLSRPSVPISFPESPCLALWYSTTSHQKVQPQARRPAVFGFLGCFWVCAFPFSLQIKLVTFNSKAAAFQTALVYFQFTRMIICVVFVQC